MGQCYRLRELADEIAIQIALQITANRFDIDIAGTDIQFLNFNINILSSVLCMEYFPCGESSFPPPPRSALRK